MKKVYVVSFLLVFFATLSFNAFAQNQAGTNKLGGIIGVPIGLSFSHNFTQKDQIDLTVGLFAGLVGRYYGRYFAGDIALGYLRTIFEPNVTGVGCPFEIGAGLSFTGGYWGSFASFMTVYLDLRWELFFQGSKFNLFFDFSPGLGFYLNSETYLYYAPRGGIGLRAVL